MLELSVPLELETARLLLRTFVPEDWQAVHAYTVGSAFAAHQEAVKGSIEHGKLADLVVLSDDIFTIPPEAIEKAKVDMTIFDGKVIYQR